MSAKPPFLALLALLHQAGLPAEQVQIPGPGGVTLNAAFVQPDGAATEPAVVMLHGCGGPFPSRDVGWASVLVHAGHPILLPDSFGSRGMGSQCRVKERAVTASGLRRGDAIAAATWLAARPGTPQGGIALMGWSNGAITTLWTARTRADLPPGLFSRFVAFYPGCASVLRSASWQPSAPLLILIGDRDDWTPAPPCRDLAARFPGQISLVTYPGAWHDFDAPGLTFQTLNGLASTGSGTGTAHRGGDPAAREDAMQRVPRFLAAGP